MKQVTVLKTKMGHLWASINWWGCKWSSTKSLIDSLISRPSPRKTWFCLKWSWRTSLRKYFKKKALLSFHWLEIRHRETSMLHNKIQRMTTMKSKCLQTLACPKSTPSTVTQLPFKNKTTYRTKFVATNRTTSAKLRQPRESQSESVAVYRTYLPKIMDPSAKASIKACSRWRPSIKSIGWAIITPAWLQVSQCYVMKISSSCISQLYRIILIKRLRRIGMRILNR